MKNIDASHAPAATSAGAGDDASLMAIRDARRRARHTTLPGVLLLALVAGSSGCATVTTIQQADEHTVKVFSGTRQDLRAIGGETAENQRYRAPPPPNPWLDLPFSFVLDVVVLPLTLPAAVSITR